MKNTIKNKKTFNQLLKKGIIQQRKEHYVSLRLNKQKIDVPLTIEKLMKTCTIIDIKVHEPRLEQVIKEIYQDK